MAVKERLKKFIKYKAELNKKAGLKKFTISEFCTSIGASKAFISSMRESIGQKKLESIALKYPELNIAWVIMESGEMIHENTSFGPIDKNQLMLIGSEMMSDKIREMIDEGILYRASYVKSLNEQLSDYIKLILRLQEKIRELELGKQWVPEEKQDTG